MAENRKFSEANLPMKADDYHGLASYIRTQPDIVAKGVKAINIEMSFEEAIRFSLAVQSCVMQLNRFNRATTEGREMGLVLSVKTGSNSITVIEKRVRSQTDE